MVGFWQAAQQAAESDSQHISAAPLVNASHEVAAAEPLPNGPGDREAPEETWY